MGFKVFQNNTTLTAEDVNDYLMEQSALVFNNVTERNNAIPTPQEGMIVYLKSTKDLTVYDGTAWRRVGPEKETWETYTPTITADTTNPAFSGNTFWGRYVLMGKTVHWNAFFTFGTVTNVGNGAWRFQGPPITPRDTNAPVYGNTISAYRGLWGRFIGGRDVYVYLAGSSTGNSDNACSNGNYALFGATVRIGGTYEVA